MSFSCYNKNLPSVPQTWEVQIKRKKKERKKERKAWCMKFPINKISHLHDYVKYSQCEIFPISISWMRECCVIVMDETQARKRMLPWPGHLTMLLAADMPKQTHISILVGWLIPEIVTAHNYITTETLSNSCVLMSGTYFNWQSKW